MREETQEFETVLHSVSARLERAGGMPLKDAIVHFHAIKRFLASCAACGVEKDLLVAMERAGVGDFAEALLPLVR
jgi:hypothetical protein